MLERRIGVNRARMSQRATTEGKIPWRRNRIEGRAVNTVVGGVARRVERVPPLGVWSWR